MNTKEQTIDIHWMYFGRAIPFALLIAIGPLFVYNIGTKMLQAINFDFISAIVGPGLILAISIGLALFSISSTILIWKTYKVKVLPHALVIEQFKRQTTAALTDRMYVSINWGLFGKYLGYADISIEEPWFKKTYTISYANNPEEAYQILQTNILKAKSSPGSYPQVDGDTSDMPESLSE